MEQFDINHIIRYARKFISKISTKGLYILLLLYYTYYNGDVPSWAKKIIIGSFAYFVSPIDSIPDMTPFIGMTDDLGVIAFGLVTIACYITDEIREKSVEKLNTIIEDRVDKAIIQEVDSWL